MSAPIGTAELVVLICCALGCVPAGLRWLRVAQREHYLAGSVSRFAWRWWARTSSLDASLAAAAVVASIASLASAWVALVSPVVAILGPVGLSVRGRTSKLRWTRRLRVLGTLWGALEVGLLASAWAVGRAWAPAGPLMAGLVVVSTPLVVDACLWISSPFEAAAGRKWVRRAERRLDELGRPTVVGITGSYGKTTTKGYVAHLLSARYVTVGSPASFNNALGLARTVNEHLPAGTEVLVAEMGAYGVGEIAALCSWMKPTVGLLTALGPVHLERFGSEERIAQAKSELLQAAQVAVCNVDIPTLAGVADRIAASGKRTWRCSALSLQAAPSVAVLACEGGVVVEVAQEGTSALSETVRGVEGAPTNVACAVATAIEMGVPWQSVLRLLPSLPSASHRLTRSVSSSGLVVLDDTYNSNPAGARRALDLLASAASGRKVVVTPGMVELGALQARENAAFAADACGVVTDFVIVGRTNRPALLAGFEAAGGHRAPRDPHGRDAPPRPSPLSRSAPTGAEGKPAVWVVSNRPEAVAWVRSHLGEGDAVLYENDLPDHFP